MSKKIGAIIQARMGSERLPGKVLKKIGNKTILEIIINRLKKSKYLDEIIVATTKKQKDDVIIDLCKKKRINYYRGSEENVLDRYIKAAEEFDIDIVVRVTADNPLASPIYMDKLIKNHFQKKSDYTYSNNLPIGIGTEIINHSILKKINDNVTDKPSKEHVTFFIRKNSKKFKINKVDFGYKDKDIRLTVDTQDDLNLMVKIYSELGDLEKIDIDKLIKLFNDKPRLKEINANINQKNPYVENIPVISVIIRSHNSERYIKNALESVLKQTLSKNLFEILVIDDGSTDDTLNILKNYKNKVRILEKRNLGAIPAINFGIKHSIGQYYILLDSDDTFEPEILEKMFEIIKKDRKVDYVYSDYFELNVKDNGKKIIQLKNNIFNCLAAGILFKKKIIENLGYYDEDLIFPEYDLIIKLIDNYNGKYIEEPLYTYIRHKGSITADKSNVERGLKQLKDKYGKLPIRLY